MFQKKYKKIIYIDGMHCEHCANKVKSSLEEIDNVIKVKVNLKDKEVVISSSCVLDNNLLSKKIEELDYKVIDIKE